MRDEKLAISSHANYRAMTHLNKLVNNMRHKLAQGNPDIGECACSSLVVV